MHGKLKAAPDRIVLAADFVAIVLSGIAAAMLGLFAVVGAFKEVYHQVTEWWGLGYISDRIFMVATALACVWHAVRWKELHGQTGQ